ncbi:MAG: alpha-glucosidase [Phycisphaeraceae bacterium]|nr:MAG: alpha-glucosidase [Phycisphaeraceae bacterium]
MTTPKDTNPELAMSGADPAAAREFFPPTPGLPPVAPRMVQRHGKEQARRERAASWCSPASSEPIHAGTIRHTNPFGDAGPNPAFVRAPVPGSDAGPTRLPAPEFAHVPAASPKDTVGGYHAARIPIDAGTSLYATGEQAGPLLRNGRSVACWAADVPGYTDTNEGLYQSHPWVVGVRADGSAFGILADTTHCCEIDLRDTIVFRALGPAFSVVVIERDHPQQVVEALAELTGTIEMPPKWALGFQQSRWSYDPAARVLEVARNFREHRLPCDVFWIDIDYMDGFRVFSFDADKFPDPPALGAQMNDLGFRVVWMLDPGIKADPEYPLFRDCVEGNHAIRAADGEPFRGAVWPGLCVFPDFMRAETRTWWADRVVKFAEDSAFDGIWVDMNEPAVFSPGGTTTMRFDARHDADEDLGGPGSHERYHNLYGMQMARATQAGVRAAHPDRRPFVLTRSNFLGGHRHAATWTGDNVSDWDHLRWTIPMILNLGLSGQPFAGCDIGGFMGDATPELFARWMGIGAMLPFARAHSAKGTKDHEPWSFGEKTLNTSRRALERRMRLMPYFYTLFHEAATVGTPVCRPLFFADPANPALRDADASFLLGADLLVRASVDEAGSPCPDPMPSGAWRPFVLEDPDADLPVLRARAGSIIPMGPACQHVADGPDELTLLITPDEHGNATGRLFEDAGDGPEWTDGERRITEFRLAAEGSGHRLTLASTGWIWPADRGVRVLVLTDASTTPTDRGALRLDDPAGAILPA